MKKSIYHYARSIIMCGLIILISQYSQAQDKVKTTSSNGLTKVEFETPNGKITLHLPNNIYAGDVISGTVITEPIGRKEKQLTKNKEILNGHIIGFADKNSKADEQVTKWLIPKDINDSSLTLTLKDNKGNLIGLTKLIAFPNERKKLFPQMMDIDDFSVPSYISVGQPAMISGHFDGDFYTSQDNN